MARFFSSYTNQINKTPIQEALLEIIETIKSKNIPSNSTS